MSRLTLRISDELNDKLTRVAKVDNQTTVNSYICGLIEKELSGDTKDSSPEVDTSSSMRLYFSEEQKHDIKEKADALGLSPAAYISSIIYKKSLVNLSIEVEDLRGLTSSINDLVMNVNGIATVLLRSGKAYEQDLEKILSLMGEINDKVNEVYLREVDDRRKLYSEARKKVYADIESNKIVRRNRRKETEDK